MTSIEMVTVRMSRGDIRTPWGFEIIPPCTVTKVIGSSLADRAGLHNGDHIDELQGLQGPTFEKAMNMLRSAAHEIELVVLRDPVIASRFWQPQVTVDNMPINNFQGYPTISPPSQHAPQQQSFSSTYKATAYSPVPSFSPSVKVSLEHKPVQEPNVPGFNRSPHPYQAAELNNNQINYSKPLDFGYTNRAEQYLLEKGGLFGTDPAVMKAREQPSYLQSETLKLIQEEEKHGRQQQRPRQTKTPDAVASREVNGHQHKQLPPCFICGRSIVGVTCRIKDALVHPECFQCSTCGSSLRNVGHHFFNEKFYCDIHGQQRQQQLGGNMKGTHHFVSNTHFNPDLAVKISPSAAQPMRVLEPPRGFYQPDILSAGPLSPAQPPKRPPLDSYTRTTVYSNQEEINNDDLIIIGKQSTSATLEARQMSRNFAPFIRARSVRGIQWPPPSEKAQKTADAIRYWKFPNEPADREKKSLQQLISEDNEIPHKKPVMKKSPSPERAKMNAKRVIATPNRLLQPMRNPLEAYTEKVRSHLDLSNGSPKSAASLLSLGQPPAVNISYSDLVKAQSIKPSPSQRSDAASLEKSVEHLQIPNKSPRIDDSSPEPNSESQLNDEWQAKSEILEEKDILTDASSIRHSDDEDIEEDPFSLPRFDERTSQFLSDQRLYDDSVSPSMDDIDRKSIASTIKEGDDDDAVSQAEKERWMREEVEQARKEEVERQKKRILALEDTTEEYPIVISESVEKLCLEELAQTPLQGTEEQNKQAEIIEREMAIDVIKEHQENLQQQQHQLSELLDNALKYLKDTDYQKPSENFEISETNNNKNISPQPFNYEDNTPAAKIIRSLNAYEDGQRKSTIYEQQRMPAGKSLSQPPTNDSNQGYTDGIRQHGTLVSQTNMIPYCEHCKQQIRGAYVLAAGLTWCPEHFTCANPACNRRLLDTGFVEEKGKKYCEKCFETLIAPICNKCGMPITADCLTALQKQWHPECFVCHHCSQPFGNAAFYLENGRPYCEQDWNTLFTTKCIACKFPIEAGDRWVEAIGSAFHSNCFSCTVCQTNLEGQSFYAKNGLPFCRIHA